MNSKMIPEEIMNVFKEGTVIPAMPLALNRQRKLDEKRQRALIRYYLDAGAGGLAVAVHTTQFEIREPGVDLFRPVLQLAREEFDNFEKHSHKKVMRIAGVIGKTDQAVREARLAEENGYHAVLLSLAALPNSTNRELIEHCKKVAEVIPVIGFYLQKAVGGRDLDTGFWCDFAKIDNIIGVKIAPFNRYKTLDVLHGVAASGRIDDIALYTGNDDNIVVDLLTEYEIIHNNRKIKKRICGGLLGHWSVWTKTAVDLLNGIKQVQTAESYADLLTTGVKITDCNAAFFDAANNFRGCISGIHEVLRRQGFLEDITTLSPEEKLSDGQMEEITRVYNAYPELNDDSFVKENIDRWFS